MSQLPDLCEQVYAALRNGRLAGYVFVTEGAWVSCRDAELSYDPGARRWTALRRDEGEVIEATGESPTAAVLALVARHLGYRCDPVYDGDVL